MAASNAALLKTVDALQVHMDDVKAQLHLQAAVVPMGRPPITASRPFDGSLDTTILTCNAHGRAVVSAEAVKAALDPVFLHGNVGSHEWKVVMSDGASLASNRFVLQFHGETGMAERHAIAAFQSLRDKNNRKIKVFVTGGTQIYVDPDKTPKTLKLEGALRRMLRVLLDDEASRDGSRDPSLPRPDFRIRYESGEITKEGVDICKLEAGESREDDITFMWNLKGLADKCLKRDELIVAFNANSPSRARVTTVWST